MSTPLEDKQAEMRARWANRRRVEPTLRKKVEIVERPSVQQPRPVVRKVDEYGTVPLAVVTELREFAAFIGTEGSKQAAQIFDVVLSCAAGCSSNYIIRNIIGAMQKEIQRRP